MTGPKEKDHNDNTTRDFEKLVHGMYETDEDEEDAKEEDKSDE